MEEIELTIRVPRDLLEDAERFARENGTTLTRLISGFLRQLSVSSDLLADAPIVQRLSGTLPSGLSADDYRQFLRRKHGSDTEGS